MKEVSSVFFSVVVVAIGVFLFRLATDDWKTVGALLALVGCACAAGAVCDHAERKALAAEVARRAAADTRRNRRIVS